MKLKFFILLWIGSFIFSGIIAQELMVDQVVGVVGNKAIKLSDIETEYLQMKAQGISMPENARCAIYEKLLDHKLLLNQAIFDSIEVSESQLEAELNQRMDYFINQIGSVEKLEKYFNKRMKDIKDELRENLREQQLDQKEQGSIVQDITITPNEVEAFFNTLPADSVPHVNGQYQLAQLAIYPPFTDKAVEEMRDKLLNLRKRIMDGEKFATLAALYSEDDGSARKGGEIGFLTKGELDPDYAKAAFALNNPGDVSRIVETSFGYHIIQLIEKRGDRVNTRHILMKPKLDPDVAAKQVVYLDSIADLIRKDSLTFKKAVMIYSMDPDTRFNYGLVLNANTGSAKFEVEQIAPADYNAIRHLKVGEISRPFESRDKNGRIIYKIMTVTSKTEPHIANLKLDFNLIADMAKANKQTKILENWMENKRKSTFIHIDASFKSCHFKSDQWLKVSD